MISAAGHGSFPDPVGAVGGGSCVWWYCVIHVVPNRDLPRQNASEEGTGAPIFSMTIRRWFMLRKLSIMTVMSALSLWSQK